MVVVGVGATIGLSAVGAVELIVGHRVEGGHMASERVCACHSHVDQCFTVADEVFADHVAAVTRVTIPSELAVCVLSKIDLTL